jgi:hypothetical protein
VPQGPSEATFDRRTLYRTLRLCSGGGGFEAIPRSGTGGIDLAKARGALESAGVRTIDARVMLIAALEAEVTITAAGRILIKTKDAALAERTFDRVLSLLREGGRAGRSSGAGIRSG